MSNTRKSVFQNIAVCALVAVLILSLVLTLSACGKNNDDDGKNATVRIPVYNTTGNEQKAIIIVPGILGSNLVSAADDTTLWSAGALISNIAMNSDMLDSEGRFDMDAFESYLGAFLYRDSDGNVKTPVRAANMNDADLEYGFLNAYQSIYDLFNTEFGPSTAYGYQVKVFQYDWTQSCADSAADLAQFISKNKYTDLVLVGHSMGGLVIDNYLASPDSLTSVKTVITLGTPHFGAVDSPCFTLGAMLPAAGSLISDEEMSSMFAELDGKLPAGTENAVEFGLLLTKSLQKMARTLPSAYDLFPTDALEAATGETTYTLKGKSADVADIVTEMKTKSWVSENAHISAVADKLAAASPLYSDGVFVIDKVKTFYFAGSGVSTTLTSAYQADDSDFYFSGMTSSDDGDSLVLVASAVAGHDVSAENVVIIDGVNHIDLIKTDDNGTLTTVGTKLKAALKSVLDD